MSINYFRNLKKQQPIDNRPKYLRYGDIFTSSRNNNNRQQQQQQSRYSSGFCTSTMQMEYPRSANGNNINNNKYKVFEAANIDRIRTTNRINLNTENDQRNNMYDQYENMYNSTQDHYEDDLDYSQQQQQSNNNNQFNQQVYNSNYTINDFPYQNNTGRVNYRKRQLPPLQQKYSSRNSQYDLQYDSKYWDDYDPYQNSKTDKKQDRNVSLKFIWQKFIITFTSILSIVCIAWIAYHWHGSKSSGNNNNGINTLELIKQDKPSFKVLPDVPGGMEISYQDKSIYNRVDPTFKQKERENLRKPQEIPNEIPKLNTPRVTKTDSAIEEYSIVDEYDYYVKCPIDGDKNVAVKQLNLIKKKLSTFPDSDMLDGTTCAIRTVANTAGKKGKFILIGSFNDYDIAKQIGHFCKIKGEIISVRKQNRN